MLQYVVSVSNSMVVLGNNFSIVKSRYEGDIIYIT